MGVLSIHATVAPTQSFLKWTEKKEREQAGEREGERINPSLLQPGGKKEALTLNEQNEAGCIAAIHFTLTPTHK